MSLEKGTLLTYRAYERGFSRLIKHDFCLRRYCQIRGNRSELTLEVDLPSLVIHPRTHLVEESD